MEEALKRIDALVAKIGEVVSQHGPDALDLVGSVYQAKAIAGIISPFAALAFGAALYFMIFRPAWIVTKRAFDDCIDEAAPYAIGGGVVLVCSGIVAGVSVAYGFSGLLERTANPIYWMAAFDAKFAIAANILKVM